MTTNRMTMRARVRAGQRRGAPATHKLGVIGLGAAAGWLLATKIVILAHPTAASLDYHLMAMSAMACAAYTIGANLLSMCPQTRHAGDILVSRILCAASNWRTETLRSFVELGTWLGVNYATLEASGRYDVAILCGSLSGIIVCLGGDYMTGSLRSLERQACILAGGEVGGERGVAAEKAALDAGNTIVVGVFGWGAISFIYDNVDGICLACLLTGVAGCALLTASQVRWPS